MFLSVRQAASCAIILLILPPYITVNIPGVSVILRNFFVVFLVFSMTDDGIGIRC